MTGKNQHVVPHQDAWAVKGAGNQRATSVHDTQQQAIDAARDIARNQQSELIIHPPRRPHPRQGQPRQRLFPAERLMP